MLSVDVSPSLSPRTSWRTGLSRSPVVPKYHSGPPMADGTDWNSRSTVVSSHELIVRSDSDAPNVVESTTTFTSCPDTACASVMRSRKIWWSLTWDHVRTTAGTWAKNAPHSFAVNENERGPSGRSSVTQPCHTGMPSRAMRMPDMGSAIEGRQNDRPGSTVAENVATP